MFRAMEADAQTNAVTACYELYQLGDKAPYEIFKSTYPEIEKAFHDALVANNGLVDNRVMTEAFKGWYDQNGTKRAYERGYELEPMEDEIADLKAGKKPTLLYNEPFDTAETVKMASYTDNGSYFVDDPKILESGKYLDVAESSMRIMKNFFEIRKTLTGLPVDKTLAELPVRPDYPPRNFYFQKTAAAAEYKTEKAVQVALALKKNNGR